jgi:hypothetical protein
MPTRLFSLSLLLLLPSAILAGPRHRRPHRAVYHIQLPERFLQDAARQHWQVDAAKVRGMELNWDAFDAITVERRKERPRRT